MQVEFAAQSEWVGKATEVTSPWIVVTGPPARHRPARRDRPCSSLPISLGSHRPGRSPRCRWRSAYEDKANDFNVSKDVRARPGDPVVTWKLRLSDPTQRTYSYRCTYVFKDNVKFTGAWVTTADTSLIVNDPFTNVMNLRFVPVLDPRTCRRPTSPSSYSRGRHRLREPGDGDVRAADADIGAGDHPDARRQAGRVLLRRDHRACRRQREHATAVNATADDTAVPVHDGDGSTHRINMQLVDPSLGGLLAIKVDVTGPDGDAAEVIFTPTANAAQKVTLISATGLPWAYRYTVTGYSAKGLPITGDTGATAEPQLLVRTPAT